MICADKTPRNENHKAVNRAKNQIGILKDTVDRQGRKIPELEKQNWRLKKEEVEKLKCKISSD